MSEPALANDQPPPNETTPPPDDAGPPPRRPKRGRPKKNANRGCDEYLEVVAAIQGGISRLPSFPENFAVIQDVMGNRRVLRVSKDCVVSNTAEAYVQAAILRYSHITLAHDDSVQLLGRDALEIAKLFAALTKPVAEEAILPVAEKSDLGLCWHRLPFDIMDNGKPTPTFDELMSRTGNHKALMAWVGGLLVPNSDRQQYLYLCGSGQNGKGRFAAFLAKLFGPAYRSEIATLKHNNFWTSGLVGARLVVFPDFDAWEFPNGGFFKSLTGDDLIRIEEKNQAPYTTRLGCKFLFLANDDPSLDDSAANKRRAIYCKVAPLRKGTARLPAEAYEARLWEEAPTWLARCKKEWNDHAAATGFIAVEDDEVLQELMDTSEAIKLDIVERWFNVGADLHTKNSEMQSIMRREKLETSFHQKPWFQFLKNRFGARKCRPRHDDGSRERGWEGLAVKESMRAALEKY